MPMADVPAYRYRATARDASGREIIEVFTSDVEYVAGDELPLDSRWHVRVVVQERIAHIDGQDQTVRELDCILVD